MIARLRAAGVITLALALAGCGGGGTTISSTAKTPLATNGHVSVTLHFPTNIHYAKRPASSTNRVPPQYLNPTPGAVISITDNGESDGSDIFVNAGNDGSQTIEVPVVGGIGTTFANSLVVSEYNDSNHDNLLAQASTYIQYTAGTDSSYSLQMQMNAVGAAFTTSASSQGTVLSTDSFNATPEYLTCSSTFFVYAIDATNAFVASAYPGVPQVLLGSQESVSGSATVTQLPTGGFSVSPNYGNEELVTFTYLDPLYGDTVNTYADLIGEGCP